MSSMLQALFWTPAFRRLVYEMPTERGGGRGDVDPFVFTTVILPDAIGRSCVFDGRIDEVVWVGFVEYVCAA
jgi:hypothetical protein